MKHTIMVLGLLLVVNFTHAQTNTKKTVNGTTRSHTSTSTTNSNTNSNTVSTKPATSIENNNTGERINPVQGTMNANGNNTQLYNSTHNMNDGAMKSAIDTSKIR